MNKCASAARPGAGQPRWDRLGRKAAAAAGNHRPGALWQRALMLCLMLWVVCLAAPATATGIALGPIGLGEAQHLCRPTVNTDPWMSGIALAQPGRWWNPKRYGTGWDLVYSDDRLKMKVFLYTFNAEGHPVWLASKMTSIDSSGDFWTDNLYEYVKLANPPPGSDGYEARDVGKVYFRFFRDDPSRIAMQWQWKEISATTVHEECLADMTRLNPTYYTGVSSAPVETKALSGPDTSVEFVANQIFSGYWSDQTPADPNRIPGVVMTIMQTSLGNEEGKFGEAAVRLTFNDIPDAQGNRHPIYVQAQRTALRTSLPLTSDSFDLYLHYAGPRFTGGFATNDCPTVTDPTTTGCVSNHRIGTYTREFRSGSGYRSVDATFAIDPVLVPTGIVTNPVQGRTSVRLAAGLLNSGTQPIYHRTTKLQDISVNRYVCAASNAQNQCPVSVSWAGNATGKPWLRDLGTMQYASAPLSTADFGVAEVQLRLGDRVQFELWQGTPGAAGAVLLDRTPEVRAVSTSSASPGEITVPNAPIISNEEDLPPSHDATVGAVAGSADVSGGAATYTVPIALPPGRSGMQPSVSLNYSSRGGNGIAGLGWSVGAGSSIQRCPHTRAQDGSTRGVRLDGGDRLCLDGQRLMPAPGSTTPYGAAGSEYRTEIESFARISQSGSLAGGDVCFSVQQKDGRVLTYGCQPAGQACAASVAPRVRPNTRPGVTAEQTAVELTWLLSRVEDRSGNTMDYCYIKGETAGEVLLDRIAYTGSTKPGQPAASRSVRFEYEGRPSAARANDRSSSWIAGGAVQQSQRLKGIATYSPDSIHPARRYKLDYTDTAVTTLDHSYTSGRSLLRRIRDCAYHPSSGAETCLRPTEFTWSDGSWEFTSRRLAISASTPGVPVPDEEPVWQEGGEAARAPVYVRNRVMPIGDLDGDGARETLVTTSRYDGQDWQFQSWLSKVTADRVVQGAVALSNFSPGDATDFDGNGIAELLHRGKLYRWKRGRGAAVCDGGAATCTAAASTYFQEIATNLPTGPHDFIQSTADFNGDGAPDVLVRMAAGSVCASGGASTDKAAGAKAVEPPGGTAPLCLFLNLQPGAITDTTTSFAFAAPTQIRRVSAGNDGESVQHVADLDGNGVADIVIANTFGVQEVLRGQLDGGSLSFVPTAQVNLGLRSYTRNLRWMDVNGDGLDDVVIADVPGGTPNCNASGCFATWVLQLNQGGTFGAEIYPANPPGSLSPGLSTDDVGSQRRLRYYDKMIQTDIDADGRVDLLYPAHFAARLCFTAKLTRNLFLWPRPGPEDCPLLGCDAQVCPAPPPEDGSAYSSHPSAGVLGSADTFKSGLGEVDPSVYRYNAIRFVQTGANTFRLQVDETPIMAGASHLGNQRGHVDDYFGDGLMDVVADAGCPLLPSALFPDNTCELSAGGSNGPGSPTSYLDAAQTIRLDQLLNPANVNLVINENLGDGARAGLAPAFPDLLVRSVNALNDRAQWDYFPLSSSAGRSGTDFPLYRIDASYVDAQHFLFQSSMPVVAQLARSHAATSGTSGLPASGARSQRYSYGGAMYNRQGRGFQGFRSIASETFGSADRTLRTLTTYHQKFPLTGRVQSVETRVPQVAGGNGTLSLETIDWRCDRSHRLHNCPGQDGAALAPGLIYWPYLSKSVKEVYDLATAEAAAPPLRVSTTVTLNADPGSLASGWDEHGNLTYQQVTTADGAGLPASGPDGERYYLASHVSTTENAYDASVVGQGWLDKLTHTTTTSSISYHGRAAPAGLDLASKQVRKQFGWNADRTLAWTTVTDLAGGASVRTDYGYPAASHGLPDVVTVSGNPLSGTRATRTSYSADGYFPVAVTAVLSASVPALNHTTASDLRASDGQPRMVTDPNGLRSISEYDVFGRRTRLSVLGSDNQPLMPASQTRLSACIPVPSPACTASDEYFAAYYQTTVADGAPSQRQWFDILGREVKRAVRGFDGRWVATATRYDAQGAVRETSAPYFAGETPLFTQATFDRLNRVLTRRAPTAELNAAQGDLLTRYIYSGLRTDIHVGPANGQCQLAPNLCFDQSRQLNALGQLMRTRDAQGGLTDYWLDPIGNAAALRDASGRATLASYNGFGHRLRSSDPNQGEWSFTYNALGELLTQTDARQVRTTIVQRDALGRVLQQRREPLLPVAQNGPLADERTLDSWEYDTAGIKGQVATVTRRRSTTGSDPAAAPVDWQESYGYWLNSGRLQSRTTSIAGGPLLPLIQSYQYDPYYGYLSGVTYPNTPQPLTVWKRYTRYGALTGLVDARLMTPLWSMSQADVYGKPTQEQFGYALTGRTDYSRATGQMLSQDWQPFDRPTFNDRVDQISYGYDVLGNLVSQDRSWRRYDLYGRFQNLLLPTTVIDHRGRGRETYRYDTLQRLLSVERQVNEWHPGPNYTQEWSLIPASPAQIDYRYDAVGNITAKSDFASSYVYGTAATPAAVGSGDGLCGPNALSQTVLDGQDRTYACDANGNQVRETYTGSVAGSRKVVYDGANLPTRIDHSDPWNGASFGGHVGFAYGPDNARYRRIENNGAATYYGADGYEQEYLPGAPARTVHRMELGPVVYTRVVTAAQGNTPGSAAPALVEYQLRDRLGSTIAIADRWGHFNGSNRPASDPFPTVDGLLRRFYDPFGAPRYSNFASIAALPELRFGRTSLRGFTGHEHLDGARLIHMNGRAFDYRSGRFLSVDPFVQSPGSSQSLNPYSYVFNNPLAGVDPSGYAACRVEDPPSCLKDSVNTVEDKKGNITTVIVAEKGDNVALTGNGFVVEQLKFVSGTINLAWNPANGADDWVKNGPAGSQDPSGIGRLGEKGKGCAGDGPLQCYSVTTKDGKAVGFERSLKVSGSHGAVNGILNNVGRAMYLMSSHVQSRFGAGSFLLVHNPTEGAARDLWEATRDKIGWTTAAARQFSEVLADVDHPMSWVAHSQGGAIFSEAMRVNLKQGITDMSNIRVAFHSGANNRWMTNRYAGKAGVGVVGYYDAPNDLVPQVVGLRAWSRPDRFLRSILSLPKLFGDDSPHTYAVDPDY